MLIRKITIIIFSILTMNANAQDASVKRLFNWSLAQSLPDPDGFAGSYAGVSNGMLLVAGGSNFPNNKRPWDGGAKAFYDKIFVLENLDADWKEVGKLPHAMGYGVALTYKNGLLCIGGGDAQQNYKDAFILTYQSGKIETTLLPSMPDPLINACGVIINNVVYVMGGIKTISGITENNFWSLDLSARSRKWIVHENIPWKSRMLAMSAASGNNVYLFGGVHLVKSGNTLQREYLKDCWKYSGIKGWKRIPDLPYRLAAAPSPAYKADKSTVLLFGGDDGLNASKVFELKDNHPGFRNEILGYNTIADKWFTAGKIPVDKKADSITHPHNSVYAPVTTPLVIWRHDIIIAGGEARPAVRSNKVLVATPERIKNEGDDRLH